MNQIPQKIIFISGASGAGKTTLVDALAKQKNSAWVCLHFDSIGVPSEAEMIKMHGSPSEWQKAITFIWVEKILAEYQDKEVVILEGQVNLDFIEEAFKKNNVAHCAMVLVHCDFKKRHERLHQDRNQPELINDNMDNWARYLHNQAIQKNVPILDTSLMTVDEMVKWMMNYLNK